jgi:predicted metalloprotease
VATANLPSPTTTKAVDRRYLMALFDDAQSVWRREFAASHLAYEPARLILFSIKVVSGCGHHEDSGPFYCPADRTIYLDHRFFSELLRYHRVGVAAEAFIVGHEFGHHVQRLLGIASRVAAANAADPRGENARSVKVELQADCLAGVWASSAYPRTELTVSALHDALKTAEVIGDDYLHQAAGDVVDSATWTHGSSQQRQDWLRTGFKSGRPDACDTFAGG